MNKYRWVKGRRQRNYRFVWDGERSRLEHRVIWENAYGEIPKWGRIHHKNEDPRDNRRANLLLVTQRENLRLSSPAYKKTNGQWIKRCCCCRKIKPLSEYYRRLRGIKTAGSVQCLCKLCSHKRVMKIYYKRKGVIKNVG